MASGSTAAAVVVLLEINREVPVSERHIILDPLGLGPSVNLVAGPASPPFLPVNVDEMQVLLAVSKPRESCRSLIEHERFLVALEAEFVRFELEWPVEFGWKIVLQDTEILGTVRLMTCRAHF